MSDQEWRLRAACRGTNDPNLFFRDSERAIARAREICDKCPVAKECLRFALTPHGASPAEGVWAGTTEYQRHRMRGAQRQAAFRARRNERATVEGETE